MNWFEDECITEEGNAQRVFMTQYLEKHMSIGVEIYSGGLQAKLKAMIFTQGEKKEVEYFYQRMLVGIGEEFYKRIFEVTHKKMKELEIIAQAKDL